MRSPGSIFSLLAAAAIFTSVHAALPNVVLILADDLGYGGLGCSGATTLKTPRIDRLAAEGRRFTDAHTASAVCSPSRYGLLTGRYPLRRNFWGPVSLTQGLTIDTELLTLGGLMKQTGYATACIGKWHLGFGNEKPDWNGELKPGPLELGFGYYLATTNIHHPFTPAPQFVGTSECGRYGDFVHELDWVVGEVLDALDAMNVANETPVIFTSDNGGMFHVTGQKAWKAGHRLNGDLQGFKFGAWEGGHRVPFIARWPGKIPAGTTSDQLLSQVDLLATLAAVVERPLKDGEGADSINQLESFTGSPEKPVRETMIVSPNSPKHLTVRKGKWVYIPARGAGGFQGKKPGVHLFSDAAALPFTGRRNSDVVDGRIRPNAPRAQLYDLEADPGQEQNIFAHHPEVVRELEGVLAECRAQIPAGKPTGWINLRQ